ncbi:MAG: 6-bladed beta-propeller [Candidatus Aminicenantales bacterium]
MKKPIALIFSVVLLLAACQRDHSGWKGTIEVVNGVAIVKNPGEPVYDGDVLDLDEDLSIGASDGEDEYIFSRIGGMDVDDEGNIYAIDSSSAHVRVFDSRGQFLRTIGTKGQGPGEFQMPGFVQATSHGEIAVFDFPTQRLVFFSPDGTYLRQVSAARMRYPVMPIRLDSRGNTVGFQVTAPPPIGGQEIAKYGSDFEPLFTIAREEPEKDRKERQFDLAKPGVFCAVSPNDTIVWGNSAAYELNVLSPEGKPIRTIQKRHDRLPMTAEYREKYEKELSGLVARGVKLNFPDRFPAFLDVSVDEKEWLWVRTYDQVEGGDNTFFFDVFDAEGRYLARVPIRVNLNQKSVWKNNALYTIETGEEGFQTIKRFNVRWKIPGIDSSGQ